MVIALQMERCMSYGSETTLEKVGSEMEPISVKRTIIEYLILAIVFFAISAMAPAELENFGAL